MNLPRPGLPHAGTGRSPNRGRRSAASPAPGRVDHIDGVPDELIVAIHAAASDPDIPPQGFPALRDHVLAGGPRPDEDRLSTWLTAQEKARSLVPEVVERLAPSKPGDLSPHHLEWWYSALHYPWAEDLLVAVTHGLAVYA